MSEPLENLEDFEDLAERRRHLIAEIARQRGELAEAYRNLEKPIHYAEYGMRGFGFLRSNPWIFVAVPAIFGLVRNFIGGGKKPSAKASQEQGRGEKPKSLFKVWTGRAMQAYRFYHRV